MKLLNMIHASKYAKKVAILYTPILIISIIILFSFLTLYKKYDLDQMIKNQAILLNLQNAKTQNIFQGIFSDIRFLKENRLIKSYLDDMTAGNKDFGNILVTFSKNKKIYDQIRVLDMNGKEALRVNYNDGEPSLVPNDQLTDKSLRSYFLKTIYLPKEYLYISRFDLNIENGIIEEPYKPTIRMCLPLYNSAGEKTAILVLNYSAINLIEDLQQYLPFSIGELFLLDIESNWLMTPNKNDEFAFMFKRENNFKIRYPKAWKKIYIDEHAVTVDGEDLFIHTTIRPVPTLATEDSESIDLSFSNEMKFRPAGYEWKLVSHINQNHIINRYKHATALSYTIFFAINLALLIASIIISTIKVRAELAEQRHRELQENYFQQLHKSSESLKAQVTETKELVHILCHDLTNPIGSVSSMIDIIREESEEFDNYEDLISQSLKQAINIIEMVRTMRALEEKNQALELSPINLSTALNISLNILGNRLNDKNITINSDIAPQATVMAEEVSLINSVINNILTNAIKFSPRNNTIDIYTKAQNDTLSLYIKDYGRGIPKELLARIFDTNIPTSRKGTEGETGTGFGMPLVLKFMTAYGGEINVSSVDKEVDKDNHGTEVQLIFKMT